MHLMRGGWCGAAGRITEGNEAAAPPATLRRASSGDSAASALSDRPSPRSVGSCQWNVTWNDTDRSVHRTRAECVDEKVLVAVGTPIGTSRDWQLITG